MEEYGRIVSRFQTKCMLFSDYNKLFLSQQLYLFFQTEVSTTEMPPTSTPEMVVPTEATKEKTTEIIIIVVTVCSVLIVLCIIIFVIIYRWVPPDVER